jgi:hypothetical protein
MAEQDESEICAICQKPIVLGEGRYRVEEGAAHVDCYQRREKKADTVNPREPKEK